MCIYFLYRKFGGRIHQWLIVLHLKNLLEDKGPFICCFMYLITSVAFVVLQDVSDFKVPDDNSFIGINLLKFIGFYPVTLSRCLSSFFFKLPIESKK